MKTVQDTLNGEIAKGKSIAWWAMGYYVTSGNIHSPRLKVPIFGYNEVSQYNTKVLIDYLGSMMWINLNPYQVHYGWGGNDAPSPRGKELRRKLEQIMCNN